MLVSKAEELYIDLYESYQKQTVRNRCFILSPNGIQCLIVPVIHTGKKQLMKEIRISYAESWPQQHIRSIRTAYSRSPFYEFYADEINKLIESNHIYLFDLNHAILTYLQKITGSMSTVHFTTKYAEPLPPFNQKIKDNRPKTKTLFTPYNQVFSYKFDFTPNLSLLDLIFNTGNGAKAYLTALLRNH